MLECLLVWHIRAHKVIQAHRLVTLSSEHKSNRKDVIPISPIKIEMKKVPAMVQTRTKMAMTMMTKRAQSNSKNLSSETKRED